MEKELDEIYRLYAADVYRFVYRLSRDEALSQDILQDTMLKAIASIDRFKGNCSIKTWLCTIARNEYYNHLKSADSRRLTELPQEETASGDSVEELVADSQQAMRLHELLHRLSEPYKEVFTLRVFAELKFADIGRLFGKSENWARVTFFRAKGKMIDMMEEDER